MLKRRILIADDHQLFAEGLQYILGYSDDYEVTGIVGNGINILRKIHQLAIDILIMDVKMPGIGGVEGTKIVRGEYPCLPILAVSMQSDPESIRDMIDAGVNGYVLKTAGQNQLLEAIRAISEGHNYFPQEIMAQFQAKTNSKSESTLTKKEIEIVKEVADGMSNTQIAEKLCVSRRTVETHRKNIYSKLNIHNIAQLVNYKNQNSL